MKRINRKNLFAILLAAVMSFAVCITVSAATDRQLVHINTPGITIEIPGDAIYEVKEADQGELMTASDDPITYTLTLTSTKSNDIFTYKDLSKQELDTVQQELQQDLNADKVTTYETSQAVFYDAINNTDKRLVSTTIVNGYKYQLTLSVEKRDLTISDHGIFNTAARSILFDNIEKEPVEVNILGTVGTVVCIAIAVLVGAFIVVILVRHFKPKFAKKSKSKKSIPQKAEKSVRKPATAEKSANKSINRESELGEKPTPTIKPVKVEKANHINNKKRIYRTDSAAESFYEEIESDGLFDERADEEIPAQVQMDVMDNVPGDENFENNPVRLKVEITKPVSDSGKGDENPDLFELSRNNNEDYDEAASDEDYYQDDKSISHRVKGIFGKTASTDDKPQPKKSAPKPQRRQRTNEERAQALERRRQREANRPELKTYSDSEFVKNFDSDSYWDKYR